jgi:2'-5' RNA ligase
VSEKFLCAIATFDEETSKGMKEIYHNINHAGMIGKQTLDIPHHITLAYFDTGHEDENRELLQEVCARTKSFHLSFTHIGLFGLKVLFLAPDVNYELLDLHKDIDREGIKSGQGWTAHTTILIDEAEIIQKALPLVAGSFQQLNGRVESVSLYEFFPTRFIAKFNLQ